MKILILIFFFKIKESKITRGHNFKLVKKQSRFDVRKYSFSTRTINIWNKLSTECVHAISVNVFKNRIQLRRVKGRFYIAQYPVRWTAQSALHFLPSLADLFIPTPTRLLREAF